MPRGCLTANVYDYITNRFKLSPLTIAQLYDARWAIEKFFKWLKRTLRIELSLGRSETGYEIHVLMMLIVDILLKIHAGLPPRADHISVRVLRIISEHLFDPVSKRRKQAIVQTKALSSCSTHGTSLSLSVMSLTMLDAIASM
jgi:hypothetical protein